MFHLATAGRSLTERRDTIAGLWGRGRLLRSYLVGTVLLGLAAQERDFLVRSCALFVLDGPTCDALLGRTGSAGLLARLVERQLFTQRVEASADAFRYHAALQVQLEVLLAEELGPDATRAWCRLRNPARRARPAG